MPARITATDVKHDASSSPALMIALAAVGITLATFAAYAPSLTFGFLLWDDLSYVTENPLVRDLSPAGILKIFSTLHASNYHPLALLSYALEFEFFGLNPFVYHLTNLLLHVANAVLLLLFLLHLTRRLFPAALASLWWGIHPFHVESVTWIAERRDVLFTFFFLLSLITYQREKAGPRRIWQRPVSLALFTLACLAKAMAVSLPAVLLLLEYRRTPRPQLRAALRRILPFFLVAVGVLLITLRIRVQVGEVTLDRAAALFHNFLVVSYCLLFYPAKTLIPLRLSALYPYPEQVGLALPWIYLIAPLILGGLAVLLWFFRRDRDIVFSSLFYLATVSPILQFVPAGAQVTADRYSYLPSIGLLFLFAVLVTRARDALRLRSPRATAALLVLLVGVSLASGIHTWNRTFVWRDDRALWNDVLGQFPSSFNAHLIFGSALDREGDLEEAERQYRAALIIRPANCEVHLRLGLLLLRQEGTEEAIAEVRLVLASCPDDVPANLALANILEGLGRDAEAEPHRRAVVALLPRNPVALARLGNNLLRRGLAQEALAPLRELVQLLPGIAANHNNLGVALSESGQYQEAAAAFREAIRLAPGYADPVRNLESIRPYLEE